MVEAPTTRAITAAAIEPIWKRRLLRCKWRLGSRLKTARHPVAGRLDLQGELIRFVEPELLAVRARPGAIDHQETHWTLGHQQHVVPGAALVVDALATVGEEGAQILLRTVSPGGATTTTNGLSSTGMNAWLDQAWRSTMRTGIGNVFGCASQMLTTVRPPSAPVSTSQRSW